MIDIINNWFVPSVNPSRPVQDEVQPEVHEAPQEQNPEEPKEHEEAEVPKTCGNYYKSRFAYPLESNLRQSESVFKCLNKHELSIIDNIDRRRVRSLNR